MISLFKNERKLEIAFFAVFSVLISAIFYTLISMNGVVLGNDPAVHLEKAQIFLSTGEISLANLGWTPPLYQIVLAMVISLSGATDIGQLIFLVKALAVVVDWLLFFSVYLVASKFFNKRVGAVAALLLLMCFPMYEVNQFGGYTTVLALAFMLLVFLYTPLATERFGYLLVTFFVAFALVLSHQLAAFLALFIMPPILLFMLIKSKGAYLKVVMALIVGGGIAFFLYYFQAMIGYLDLVIEYVFFAIKAYAYQIPYTSFNAFIINFGFILFFGLSGIIIAYYLLKAQKKPIFFITLLLSFFIPLFFAESYLFGFYMPFQWFIYYLTPPMAILAAVSIVFAADKFSTYYIKNKKVFSKNWVRVVAVSIVILLSLMLVFRSDTIYGKIMEASVYYSTTDIKAQDAGVWLRSNYPQNTTVVVTEIPGFWFRAFSGKNVIAQTDPTVQRNEIAESVLSLSYEFDNIDHTMVRAYEAKGDILDETFVSIDQVWDRVSFSSGSGDSLYYTQNGVTYKVPLSSLNRMIAFEDQDATKKINFSFYDDNVRITKTLALDNSSYTVKYNWTVTPLKSEIQNASLYLTTLFDLKYRFDVAQIPGYFDWVNPWDAPEEFRDEHYSTDHLSDWAVAYFKGSNLQDHYLGIYDDQNDAGFALRFDDLPDWGNIGALASRQIDAVRFQYQFNGVDVNQTVSRSYEVLTLSKNSFSTLQPNGLQGLLETKPTEFTVASRDFSDYIQDNDIGFIVYDRNQLDTQMIRSKFVELIYSNDRYAIFRILK